MREFFNLINYLQLNVEMTEELATLIRNAEKEHKVFHGGKVKVNQSNEYGESWPAVFYPNGKIIPGIAFAKVEIKPRELPKLFLELIDFEINIDTDRKGNHG